MFNKYIQNLYSKYLNLGEKREADPQPEMQISEILQ